MPELQDRQTTVIRIHHEHVGDTPASVEIIEERRLSLTEQSYQRRIKVSGGGIPLDCGWIQFEDVGTFILENQEGKDLQHIPSEEERKEIESRLVYVSFSGKKDESFIVRPGGFFIGDPQNAANIRLYCDKIVRCKITVIPK